MTALEDDVLQPELIGSLRTVDGLLAVLEATDAPLEVQRAKVRHVLTLPGMPPLLEGLRRELEDDGLL